MWGRLLFSVNENLHIMMSAKADTNLGHVFWLILSSVQYVLFHDGITQSLKLLRCIKYVRTC